MHQRQKYRLRAFAVAASMALSPRDRAEVSLDEYAADSACPRMVAVSGKERGGLHASEFKQEGVVMEVRVSRAVFGLERGQPVVVDRPRNVRLTCRSGVAWVTLEGCSRDFVLVPGQSMLIRRHHAPVLVQGMPWAEVQFAAPAESHSVLAAAARMLRAVPALARSWLGVPSSREAM